MGNLDEFSRWPAQRFIETGVGECLTLKAAAKAYAECISIEAHQGRYLAAVELFKDQPHVHIHHGNSPEVLRRVIDPAISTVFWLDAHSVIGDMDKPPGASLCPLIEELAIIKSQPWVTTPIILIDDWGTFKTRESGPDLQNWMQLWESLIR